jgi:hypothetical protein
MMLLVVRQGHFHENVGSLKYLHKVRIVVNFLTIAVAWTAFPIHCLHAHLFIITIARLFAFVFHPTIYSTRHAPSAT